MVESKKARIGAVTWKDSRPLHILAGDSHIEMGDWYELFDGSCAVRNCGLSGATIQDVTVLVSAVPDRNPESVVLMCGINNLGRHDSVQTCASDYEKLLVTTRSALKPQKIIVLSVMPVRQSPVDINSRKLNDEVLALNERLRELCRLHNAVFVNVSAAVMNASGGLSDELTSDGLHLNQEGYRRIAPVVQNYLAKERGAPG
ncbi:MAG: GDSL-type esterase/lipase family protein [Verrucomicrobiia bacterium]